MEYLIIIGVLIISVLIYLRLANKYHIIDHPNFKNNPTKSIITGGGILFYIAVICFFFTSNFSYPYFILGLSIIALVSFIDDIIHLTPRIRLLFQFIAVGILLFQVGVFSYSIALIVILFISSVWFINSYNFMDGINGITGLYSLVVLGGFILINEKEQIIETNLISYTMLSIAVFGYYNFRKKTRLFAGDIGSISLAMIVLFLILSFSINLNAPAILLLVAVYGVDSGLTILYRMYLKENIMQPHSYHIYQKLVDVLKWSHLKVSAAYALLQLLICLVVYKVYTWSFNTQLIIVVSVFMVLMLMYIMFFRKLKKKVTLL